MIFARILKMVLTAAVFIVVLSSCGEPDVLPSENPSESPYVEENSEPRLILNPEDPLAGNTHPKVEVDLLSERNIVPLVADVLDDMPDLVYTSYRDGWSLEEVLPVGYHMYFESNHSGAFLFQPVDVFSICEVKPGGIYEETYAVFDGYGNQMTNADIGASYGSYVAWLQSIYGYSDGLGSYMDKGGNIYTPRTHVYLGTFDYEWEAYNITDGTYYYYIFVTPSGNEITYITDDRNFSSVSIMSEDILVIGAPDYTIAYDDRGIPLWKLEYAAGEYFPKIIFGQRCMQLLEMVNSQGKMALYDNRGVQLTEYVYDDIWSVGGYKNVVATIENKVGLLDLSGNQVLPFEYDSISYASRSEFGMILCKDGKYGYMEDPSTAEWTIPCVYEDVLYIYDSDKFMVKERGSYYIWKDGVKGDAAFESSIYWRDWFDEDVYLMGTGYGEERLVRGDGTVILDNIIIEGPCYDELILYRDHSAQLYGYLNSAGETAIPPQYELAGQFRDGFAIVKKDGYIKLIDKSNQVIMDTIFNDVVCWNPDTRVLAVNYTPGGTKLYPWDHNSAPESRCGLVKLNVPNTE